MKKLWLGMCLIICMLSFTACGSKKSEIEFNEENLQQTADFIISNLTQIPTENLEEMGELDLGSDEAINLNSSLSELGYSMSFEAFQSAVNAYLASYDDLGEYKSTDDYTMTINQNEATLSAHATFEKHKADLEFLFDKNSKLESVSVNVSYSTGEILTKAALNTLLGMGTVFAVLILIALLISCFKVIPKIEAAFKKGGSTATAAPEPVVNTAPAAPAVPEVNEADDSELVAVISAAIAASEDAPKDGFIVRSIKRRKTNRW